MFRVNITRSEGDKTQTGSDVHPPGCNDTQNFTVGLQSRCNDTKIRRIIRHTGSKNTQRCSNTHMGSDNGHKRHNYNQKDSTGSQKEKYKSKRGTRKKKPKSRNWKQYKKYAEYALKGLYIVIALVNFLKNSWLVLPFLWFYIKCTWFFYV